MQSIPSPLLVLHGDPRLRARLQAVASERGYELRTIGDWSQLAEAARTAPAARPPAYTDPGSLMTGLAGTLLLHCRRR